ncbi:MAG: ATP-binding protein, partial [Microcystis aeruginosa]
MTTQTRHINPYIVGRPIYDRESFFGRRKLFRFIEDNLKQNTQVILLHGQRRIGKSSVLMQIPNFVGLDEFVFIYFDLHDKTRLPLDSILQNLASTIADKLNIPQSESLSLNYKKVFSDEFLPQLIEVLKEQKRKMVWLLDEFDVLNDQTPDLSVESFFPYLETLIGQYNNLFIIPVIGRRVEDLTNLKSLFRQAVNQEIGLLEKSDAKALITEPAAHYLNYDSQAIDAILELSSGHPYFTQVICNALFLQAEEEDKSEITCDDVTKIVDDAIETAEGGLAWFRDGLPIPERVVFSAVAQAEKMAEKKNSLVTEEPLKLLREYGVIITEALNKAPENLVQWQFLETVENSEFHYKIKVKLVRYWLVKRYPLRQAIWDLEKVDLDACRLFELAEDIAENRNLSTSYIYEQIAKLNPNHFTALFKLAEDYLDTKNYQQALEKYNRAYKVDPTRAYERYDLTRGKKHKIWWNKNLSKLTLLFAFLLTISVNLFQIQTQLKEKKARLAELKELE